MGIPGGGRDLNSAVLEAASLRLRPILMTTGATVLDVLPLALADGASAESQRQIGWVIAGGMSFGTLLTLFVVPTIYSYLGRLTHKPVAAESQGYNGGLNGGLRSTASTAQGAVNARLFSACPYRA